MSTQPIQILSRYTESLIDRIERRVEIDPSTEREKLRQITGLAECEAKEQPTAEMARR